MILINHASAPISNERLSPTSKARRAASQNEFVEKGGVPNKVESIGEVVRSENRPRARFGFVKLIQDILRKKYILIKSTVQGGNRPGGEREWN